MLTKADRQAMRDRLAEVEFEWGDIKLDPPFQSGKVEIGGQVYRVAVWEVKGGEWTWEVAETDPYCLLAQSPKPVFAHVEAMEQAEDWLTSHLQPNRADTLALLDWADKVETQLGQLKVVMGDGDYRTRLANLEAARLYLFGEEADVGKGEPS